MVESKLSVGFFCWAFNWDGATTLTAVRFTFAQLTLSLIALKEMLREQGETVGIEQAMATLKCDSKVYRKTHLIPRFHKAVCNMGQRLSTKTDMTWTVVRATEFELRANSHQRSNSQQTKCSHEIQNSSDRVNHEDVAILKKWREWIQKNADIWHNIKQGQVINKPVLLEHEFRTFHHKCECCMQEEVLVACDFPYSQRLWATWKNCEKNMNAKLFERQSTWLQWSNQYQILKGRDNHD